MGKKLVYNYASVGEPLILTLGICPPDPDEKLRDDQMNSTDYKHRSPSKLDDSHPPIVCAVAGSVLLRKNA